MHFHTIICFRCFSIRRKGWNKRWKKQFLWLGHWRWSVWGFWQAVTTKRCRAINQRAKPKSCVYWKQKYDDANDWKQLLSVNLYFRNFNHKPAIDGPLWRNANDSKLSIHQRVSICGWSFPIWPFTDVLFPWRQCTRCCHDSKYEPIDHFDRRQRKLWSTSRYDRNKEIRIFSANDNGIRTVKVNTQLTFAKGSLPMEILILATTCTYLQIRRVVYLWSHRTMREMSAMTNEMWC